MVKLGKKASTGGRRRRVSRRLLLAGIGVVALIFAGVHIVHGSSPKQAATKHPSRPRVARCISGTVGHAKRVRHSCPVRAVTGQKPRLTPVERYARSILPIANHSRRYFDSVAFSMSVASLSDLEAVCTRLGGHVNLLSSQADGVAPSGNWYDTVNQLHRKVMNIYHDMQGALVNCSTAGENGDNQGAAVAQGDINNADRRMRSIDDGLYRDARRQSG